MKLNELRDVDGATHSGKGKTSGRGVKGQSSRSGVAINGFEGGQMPIYRRLPKRGFKNPFSKSFNEISVGKVQEAIDSGRLDGKKAVTIEALVEAGLIRRAKDGVRLLGSGEIKSKVSFDIAGASKSAIEKVEKAGGSVKVPEKAAAE
jgi:large subunit ribosomal protein L15